MALPAAGAGGGFSAPGAGVRLEAGRRVEVRWEGLPRGIEEMELLVSCDGGKTFARVADGLDTSAVSHDWLVPSLPTESAVLAIRGRIDGRETLLYRTDTFAIERTAGLGLQPVSYHDGELWTDTAGSSTAAPASAMADPGPRTSFLSSSVDEPDEDSSGLGAVAPSVSAAEPAAPAPAPAPGLETPRSRSPLSFPQRK